MLFASLGQKALDLIIPPRCLNCTKIVESQGDLCGSCWSELTFIEAPFCKQCGFPFEYHMSEAVVCAGCIHEKPPFTQARSLLAYNDASRHMIMKFKHGDGVHMAPYFARWLRRIIPQKVDIIVPVPLHWMRLLRRTYNQASLVTNAISKQTGVITYPDLMQRKKHTSTQGGLTRQKRMDNVRGAFCVREKYKLVLKGKAVLLVDDVLTTGATMTECTKILKRNGARDVFLLTLARVVQPQRAFS